VLLALLPKTSHAQTGPQTADSSATVPTETSSATATAEFDQTEQEAVEMHRRGIEAFKAGHYEQARALYQGSLALVPHYQTAALLGQVEAALGRVSEAAYYFALSLSIAPPDADATRLRDALAEAKRNVHALSVVSVPSEPTVEVDGTLFTRGLMQNGTLQIYLEPGQHKLRFTKPGYEDHRAVVQAGRGTSQLVQFTLRPPPDSRSSATIVDPSASHSASSPSRDSSSIVVEPVETESHLERFWPVYAGGIATLAASAVGAYFAIEARESDDALGSLGARSVGPESARDAQCAANSPLAASWACTDLAERAERRDRQYASSIGGFIAAGVLGAATLGTCFWLARSDESTSLAPSVGLDRFELLMQHQF
jgi:hypothetical protein